MEQKPVPFIKRQSLLCITYNAVVLVTDHMRSVGDVKTRCKQDESEIAIKTAKSLLVIGYKPPTNYAKKSHYTKDTDDGTERSDLVS